MKKLIAISLSLSVLVLTAAPGALASYGDRGTIAGDIYERPMPDLTERNDLRSRVTGKVVKRKDSDGANALGILTEEGEFFQVRDGITGGEGVYRADLRKNFSRRVEVMGRTFEEDGDLFVQVSSVKSL